jgi:hypothetical protein
MPPISVTPQWHEPQKEIVIHELDVADVDDTFRLYDSYLGKNGGNSRRQPISKTRLPKCARKNAMRSLY